MSSQRMPTFDARIRKVLFYDDGNPLDPRCIKRFLQAFPVGYQKAVDKIISSSKNEVTEKTFRSNLACLLPAFKMTRRGFFKGVNTQNADTSKALSVCWDEVEHGLRQLKRQIIDSGCSRERIVVDAPSALKEDIISKLHALFEELVIIEHADHTMGRVAASKVLFATLPEVSLPVDNAEWQEVFETRNNYRHVLTVMAEEIAEWEEGMGETKLNRLGKNQTTLPAIYNVLAMAARPRNI